MLRISIFIVLPIFILSCGQKRTGTNRQNEIYKIVFATGGCYGKCPVQVFSIDSSLTIKFKGIEFTDFEGLYTGTINRQYFDTLNVKLESVNYQQLDTIYSGTVDDLSTELFIYYGTKVKHITSAFNDLPDTVKSVYKWLSTLQKKMILRKTTDSINFETRIDKGLPPLREKIKFTPPRIKND